MNDSNIRGDTRTQQHGKLKRKSGMNGGGGGGRQRMREARRVAMRKWKTKEPPDHMHT